MSGESDEESSRRRLLALLGAAVLTLVGAGAGASNFFGGGGNGDEGGGVDLTVDYSVTPDESSATPTPTPVPGGDGSAGGATGPSAEPDTPTTTGGGAESEPTPTETPWYDDDQDDDSRSRASVSETPTATTTPSNELVTTSIPPVSVSDIEPGDGGTVDLSVALSGSPARLWVRGDVTNVEEGGTTEVERSAGDDGESGELQEYVQVQVWYDADGDGTAGGENVVFEGTLAGLDARDDWIALTDACVAPGTQSVRFRWSLPADAPNTVQTDGVSFSLGVAADTSDCA